MVPVSSAAAIRNSYTNAFYLTHSWYAVRGRTVQRETGVRQGFSTHAAKSLFPYQNLSSKRRQQRRNMCEHSEKGLETGFRNKTHSSSE